MTADLRGHTPGWPEDLGELPAAPARRSPRHCRAGFTAGGWQGTEVITVPDEDDPRRFTREYPLGPVFAHTVGYTSPIVGDGGLAVHLRQRRPLGARQVQEHREVLCGGLLRALPLHASRGQNYLPADVLARHRVDPQAILSGQTSPQLLNALKELRDERR